MGLRRLMEDPRYADTNRRFANRAELIAEIEDLTGTRPTAHWIALLEEAGVPCAPIQDYGQVFGDAHLLARGFFWDAPHPTLGEVRQLGSPMRFSESPTRRDRAGPLFGEDSEAVIRDLGYDQEEVEALVSEGVIKTPAQEPRRVTA
jgi:crotonobetainyl-CoA:carnitine CoA-transferase CaiB-like acyl-CoA transferase